MEHTNQIVNTDEEVNVFNLRMELNNAKWHLDRARSHGANIDAEIDEIVKQIDDLLEWFPEIDEE